jgi:ssDNA-binding Zn-finger/Zn-ribbon topoisomerase 1
MKRVQLAIVPPARQPFCVCGRLPSACRCVTFVPKTAENRWLIPSGRGHATVAPCSCPSCDPDVRAMVASARAKAQAGERDPGEPPPCPRCDGRMAYRVNGSDGRPFFGCVEYPQCRGTRPIV